jgi:hypothetical protein
MLWVQVYVMHASVANIFFCLWKHQSYWTSWTHTGLRTTLGAELFKWFIVSIVDSRRTTLHGWISRVLTDWWMVWVSPLATPCHAGVLDKTLTKLGQFISTHWRSRISRQFRHNYIFWQVGDFVYYVLCTQIFTSITKMMGKMLPKWHDLAIGHRYSMKRYRK